MKKRTKIIGGVVGFFVLIGIIGSCGDNEVVNEVVEQPETEQVEPIEETKEVEPKSEEKSDTEEQEKSEPVVEEKVVEEKKEEPKVESTLTVSQKNAIRKAEQYINFTSFSKSGLIAQLKYEGFSNEDAAFAVGNIEVNWREQAVMKAEEYLDFSPFSRKGLIDQLLYEGFSREDSEYAVDQVGL